MKQKNDPIMLKQLMTHAAETNMMLVGDADFCHYLKSSKIVMDLYTSPDEALRIPESTILTPNIMEFKRIWNSLYSEDYDPEYSLIDLYESLSEDIGELDLSLSISQDVTRVANSLNGATILKKGLVDVISDGNRVFYVKTKGSLKRCGGQGDVLAGTIGTYAYYAKLVKENEETVLESFTKEENPLLLAAVAGSVITRMA
mmetsp:Transcript_16976/g.16653  ORF Transcript_16976/g.16653 Transcript_16976/m.16653 type:complete len:201 (+) Transcript_16976:376-978(+)